MGGDVDDAATASVIIYDAEADTWRTGPPLPSASRHCSATTTTGNGAIVLHGNDSRFEYKDAAWSVVADGGCALSSACGSVLLG